MAANSAQIEGDVLYVCNLAEVAINIMVQTGVCDAALVIEHLDQRLLPLEEEQSLGPYDREALAWARARIEHMIESLKPALGR